MADPATIALLAKKLAVSMATDKRARKIVLSIITGFIFIMVLPFLLILSIMSGGGEQNKSIAEIVFNKEAIPPGMDAEYGEHIKKMQEIFLTIDTIIAEKNKDLKNGEYIDDIEIKSFFYVFYFGKDELLFEPNYYEEFVNAFLHEEGYIKEKELIYNNLEELVGRKISNEEKENIENIYIFIKYGFSGDFISEGIPGEAFEDAEFAKLMREATKHIGRPYVWGGSNPSTSFDCSGFICWSYTQSGVYDLPRTTAQGIYNQCTRITKEEAKPGDLVFFTGTYQTTRPVTHVGIYVGGDKFLHCGNPIGYASLNTRYWKKHFYAFGRLK